MTPERIAELRTEGECIVEWIEMLDEIERLWALVGEAHALQFDPEELECETHENGMLIGRWYACGTDIENGKGRDPWVKTDEPLRNLRQAAWQLKEHFGTRPYLYYGKAFGEQWGIHGEEHLAKYPLWASRWPKTPARNDITVEQVTREFQREPAIWQIGGSGKTVPYPTPTYLDKDVCVKPLVRNR